MAQSGVLSFLKRLTAPSAPAVGKLNVYVDNVGVLHTLDENNVDSTFYSSPVDGWIPAAETWTFSSADAPIYVYTAASASTKYSAGMKIKYTQSGSTSFGIIHAVSGSTVTAYMGTDYSMSGSAITAPYYSMMRSPYGFPMSPDKWYVETTDTGTQRKQDNPDAATWYNVGTTTGQLVVPIGAWNLSYKTTAYSYSATTIATQDIYVTLSTANNSESDSDFTHLNVVYGYATSVTRYCHVSAFVNKPIILAAKTTFYLNVKTGYASQAEVGRNDWSAGDKTFIRAVNAYL